MHQCVLIRLEFSARRKKIQKDFPNGQIGINGKRRRGRWRRLKTKGHLRQIFLAAENTWHGHLKNIDHINLFYWERLFLPFVFMETLSATDPFLKFPPGENRKNKNSCLMFANWAISASFSFVHVQRLFINYFDRVKNKWIKPINYSIIFLHLLRRGVVVLCLRQKDSRQEVLGSNPCLCNNGMSKRLN